jgi:hypothetical protein
MCMGEASSTSLPSATGSGLTSPTI